MPVTKLDGVEAGESDEQGPAVGREGEGVGVGADRGGGHAHGLGAHDRRRSGAAHVEDGDGVVVGVGHEQPGLVGAQLHRFGVVADVDERQLLGRCPVADVDDRHRASAGTAAARFVGPVGDVEEMAGGVEGHGEGVHANRGATDHRAHAAVGARVDDRDAGARGLSRRAHVGRSSRLAQGAGHVQQVAVEQHVAGVAGDADPVTDRRALALGDRVGDVVGRDGLGVGGVEGDGSRACKLVAEDAVGVAARREHGVVVGDGQAHEEVGGRRHRGRQAGGVDGRQHLHAAVVRRHNHLGAVG